MSAPAIRLSRVVYNLLDTPDGVALARKLMSAVAKAPPLCREHGRLHDPLFGVHDDGTTFAGCALCSGAAVRARWEAEALSAAELAVVGGAIGYFAASKPSASKDC